MCYRRTKRQTWEQNKLNRERCMAKPTKERSCGIDKPVISVWIFIVKTLSCKEIRWSCFFLQISIKTKAFALLQIHVLW